MVQWKGRRLSGVSTPSSTKNLTLDKLLKLKPQNGDNDNRIYHPRAIMNSK